MWRPRKRFSPLSSLFLVVLAITVVLQGCGRDQQTPHHRSGVIAGDLRTAIGQLVNQGRYTEATLRLNSSDVTIEVEKAMAEGDFRLIAMQGVALTLPGVDDDIFLRTPRAAVWVMPGTDDVITSDSHDAWRDAANKFAKDYNQTLQRRMQSR